VLLAGAVSAAACSGPQVYHQNAAPAPGSPGPAQSATPTKAPAAPLTANPLTGLKPVPSGRVFAVKIDDTAAGRPQTNINAADVVYVEQVEGGLTRLVALYASRQPTQVGPVRSVRLGDPELLAPYGRLAAAFSGGASGVVAAVRRTALVDASADIYSGEYFRSSAAPMPYNLMVDLPALASSLRRSTATVRDVGFRWSDSAAGLAGDRVVHQMHTTVGDTTVGFRWSGGRWVREINGVAVRQRGGAVVSTPNVIVQLSKVSVDRRDVDSAGNPSAYTQSVGSGRALIFRDGKMIDGRWTRPSTTAPTRYVDAHGVDIPLHPGGVWVLLAARGSIVHTS